MAGKRQKHPDRLAFRRGGRSRALEAISDETAPATPPCPERVTTEARDAWDALWASRLSDTFADTDLPALYRWLWWYDQWVKASAFIERLGPTVRGVRGDDVLRSRVRYLRVCEGALGKLEEAFGMTPLARLRLGITFRDARSALEDLRRPMPPERVTIAADPREYLRGEGG